MYEENTCFDPNTTMQEGLAEDGFSQNVPNYTPSFSMEDLSYHQNPPPEEPAGAAAAAAAVEVELQQQMGSNMKHCYNNNNNNNNFIDTHLTREVVHNSNQVLQYDQSNWDNNFNHEIQEMSFHNPPHHHQSFNNPSSLTDDPYPPTPDLLNLFQLARCSLPNSSLSFMTPTQKSANFQASLGFLGDLPSAMDTAYASSVIYDPLFHFNLPAQPPLFRELFQSGPHVYNLGGSRTDSLFGGGGVDETEGSGGMYQDGERRHFDSGVLEFTGDMSCMASRGSNRKGTTKHCATDRQKREYMNDKYKALSSLVPNPSKSDRASVVGDAIEYIKELLRTVNELKILVEKKRCGRERSKRHKTDNGSATGDGECSNITPDPEQSYNGSTLRSSWLQRKSKDTEVDIRIIDDEVTIKLGQRKKINCLLIVSKVLDELQLDIQHVSGGLVADNYSYLFNSKICEGSSVYASAIANKLIEVMNRQDTAIPPTSSYYG
ncbi:Transcription factor bHLH10 [Camellia lanceoleosa]|uniref:Transcription factor bHLH10 n=1 Tax=Camellia lanceoleosa TaxID=1840588 RepID=A0ACC0IIE6_9ERIC|nr:Transcription factor bHLH10 [Camellia lanceoleosa]